MIRPGPGPIADRPAHEFALADSNDEFMETAPPGPASEGLGAGVRGTWTAFFSHYGPAALARAKRSLCDEMMRGEREWFDYG